MATIKTNMELYLGYIQTDKLVDDYLKLFQSRGNTILAYEGLPVRHSGLHSETFAQMYLEVTQEKFSLMDSTIQAEMTAKSRGAQQEEYLTCLLLQQLSNMCFGELKTKNYKQGSGWR